MATSENLPKLHEIIEGIRFAMLTTIDTEGHLRSRPMSTIEIESDHELWFFTHFNSEKTHEVELNQHVNVSYADPDRQKYVSVSGRANIVRDRNKMEQYWNPIYKAWFPNGLDDPNLSLIRVDIEQAEYWDAPSSRMVRALSHLAAFTRGEVSQTAENKKVAV
jgi:general stress protein 26